MKSKVGKISGILLSVIVIILSLLVMNIVNAQNITGNFTFNSSVNDSNSTVLEFNETISNDTVSNETSSDDWGGGNETNETVEELGILPIENTTNISLNQTNETSSNETEIVENEDLESNLTENQTDETSVNNETSLEEIVPESQYKLPEGPVFDIVFEYPEKITRGETATIKGVATANSDLKNVVLEWKVPEDFTVLGTKTISCGNLAKSSSCESEINVMTDLSSGLGFRDIELVVNYEE